MGTVLVDGSSCISGWTGKVVVVTNVEVFEPDVGVGCNSCVGAAVLLSI